MRVKAEKPITAMTIAKINQKLRTNIMPPDRDILRSFRKIFYDLERPF
jgi:hypothetical protein